MEESESLYPVLFKTMLLIDDSNNRFFQRFNLGVTRYYALLHAAENPGLSLSNLSERLFCTKGNTTRVIKSLEQDGLLQREADRDDSRAARLFITPKGETLLEAVRKEYTAFSHRRFACLDEVAKGRLRVTIEQVNEHLERLIQEL